MSKDVFITSVNTVNAVQLVKVADVTASGNAKISRTLNTATPVSTASQQIALSPLIAQMPVGTEGSVASENAQDTLYFNYVDTAFKVQGLLINAQAVTVPYSSGGAIWGLPPLFENP